jgi:hypothetical protein
VSEPSGKASLAIGPGQVDLARAVTEDRPGDRHRRAEAVLTGERTATTLAGRLIQRLEKSSRGSERRGDDRDLEGLVLSRGPDGSETVGTVQGLEGAPVEVPGIDVPQPREPSGT